MPVGDVDGEAVADGLASGQCVGRRARIVEGVGQGVMDGVQHRRSVGSGLAVEARAGRLPACQDIARRAPATALSQRRRGGGDAGHPGALLDQRGAGRGGAHPGRRRRRDLDGDVGRGGAAIAVRDGVAEPRGANVAGGRREGDLAPAQRNRAVLGAGHCADGQDISFGVAVVGHKGALLQHQRGVVGRRGAVVGGYGRIIHRRDGDRSARRPRLVAATSGISIVVHKQRQRRAG